MADSFMPLWNYRVMVRAMKITAIEAPEQRRPFMWAIVGEVGPMKTHVEMVHACFIGSHKPQVGGYLVRDGDHLAYWKAADFERGHARAEDPVPDIDPLAGKVWGCDKTFDALRYDRDNPFGYHVTPATAPMEGVNIDKAHGQAKPEAGR